MALERHQKKQSEYLAVSGTIDWKRIDRPQIYMLERLLQYLGLPAAVAATVALTWDTFTGLNLAARLVATLVLAGVVQELLARALAPTPPEPNVGFRFPDEQPSRPNRRWLMFAGVVLAAAAALASGLALLQTERLVVSAARSEQDTSRSLTLTASWVKADYVILPLPPPPVECSVTETGAILTDVDWEQPDRTLRIDEFVAPQTVSVTCNTEVKIGERGLAVNGPADGPYFVSDLKRFQVIIVIVGVAIWLFGVFRLRQLSLVV